MAEEAEKEVKKEEKGILIEGHAKAIIIDIIYDFTAGGYRIETTNSIKVGKYTSQELSNLIEEILSHEQK